MDELLSFKEAEIVFKRGRTWFYAMRKLGLTTHGGRVSREEIIAFLKIHPHPENEWREICDSNVFKHFQTFSNRTEK